MSIVDSDAFMEMPLSTKRLTGTQHCKAIHNIGSAKSESLW